MITCEFNESLGFVFSRIHVVTGGGFVNAENVDLRKIRGKREGERESREKKKRWNV